MWYFYYGNSKSNRGTVIVVKRVFSLAKTIVVDVFVIYIPRIPLWYFLLWEVEYILINIIFVTYGEMDLQQGNIP